MNKQIAWPAAIINGPTVRILLFIAMPIHPSITWISSIAPVIRINISFTSINTGIRAIPTKARLLANIYNAFSLSFPFPFTTAPIEKAVPKTALINVTPAQI